MATSTAAKEAIKGVGRKIGSLFDTASDAAEYIPENEPDILRSLKSDRRLKKGGGGIPSDEVLAAVENRRLYRQEKNALPKPAGEMSEAEWRLWGDQYGVDMSRTPSQSMGVSDARTKQEVMIPGGLEGEFTIPDLFQIKANNFDPGLLDQQSHNELMKKFMRTYRRPGGSDPVDIFNDLNFALMSPNAPLTPNEFIAQRTRVSDMDELSALAGKRGTEDLGRIIDRETGVGAAARGGMGVKGTAALGNQADLAGLLTDKPELFYPGDDETLRDVGFRVMNQVPGLSVKTASLGVPWTNLDKANTSAVDLWMIRKNYGRLAKENPDFKKRLDALVEKGHDPETAAISIIGGGHPSRLYRSKKTGEANKNLPPYLSPEKLAYEPEKFTTPNPFYEQIMGYVDESRGANPEIELFPEQWRLWDTYRGRVEPHEFAHPDWRNLPKQSFTEMQQALSEHKNLGYMKAPETGQPPLPTSQGDWRKLYYGKADPSLLPWLGAGGAAAALALGSQDSEASFAGLGAKTADKMMVDIAHKMEGAGHSPSEIWEKTGWGRGADRKWRFEIDDSGATFNQQAIDDAVGDITYGDVIDHPELYRAYPELADVPYKPYASDAGDRGYFFGPKQSRDLSDAEIGVNTLNRTPDQQLSTGIHEGQHGIQMNEGFARGSTPEAFSQYELPYHNAMGEAEDIGIALKTDIAKQWEQIDNSDMGKEAKRKAKIALRESNPDDWRLLTDLMEESGQHNIADLRQYGGDKLDEANRISPYNQYQNEAGEVEARNVQHRQNWTPQERRQTPPVGSQDTPTQLQRFGGKVHPGGGGTKWASEGDYADSVNARLRQQRENEQIYRDMDKRDSRMAMFGLGPKEMSASVMRAPKHPTVDLITRKMRGAERALEGSPAGLLFPSDFTTYLERMAYGDEPTWGERAWAALDVLPF